jgi:type I restriction enzyme, S subunit
MMDFLQNIPGHWRVVKLHEVAKWGSGGTPKSTVKEYYSGKIPWLIIGDLNDSIISKSKSRISELGLKNSSAKIVQPNNVLIAMYGSIGKLGINSIPLATNQAIAFTETLNPNTYNKFLFFYLLFIRPKLFSLGKGGTQLNISQTVLKAVSFPLPPLPEQHRIVEKIEELFSELDNGIANLKEAKEQLKVYRQSILKWVFEGRQTNEDVKDGELPKLWKLMKLKDITIDKVGLRRGPFGSSIKKEFFVPSGYKVYEQGNAIYNDTHRGKYFIDEQKYHELINFNVIPGDLIVSCSGTLGRICEISEDAQPGIINQALLRIRLKKDLINNKYFILHFSGAYFQKKIFDQSQGTAMSNLVGIKDFKEIEIIVPPIEEQYIIFKEIESRFSIADRMEKSIDESLLQAEALRQSILKSAFVGRLV